MIDIETRAQAAGRALRSWTPDTDTPTRSADTAATRAVRRTRIKRAAAGAVAAGVLVAGAVTWWPDRHSNVETRPGQTDMANAPEDRTPSTTGEQPTTTSTVPETTASTTTATAAPPSQPSTAATCTAEMFDTGVTVEVTLPEGWYANEADPNVTVGSCHLFGPDPVSVTLDESHPTFTNAVVWFSESSIVPSQTVEAIVESRGGEPGFNVEARTVDGRPAARLDVSLGPAEGFQEEARYVKWQIDLGGDLWLDATTEIANLPDGMTFEQLVEGLDHIVTNLQIN